MSNIQNETHSDQHQTPNPSMDSQSGIFGVPTDEASARIIIIPVPWEATTSYGQGTALGPESVLAASSQVDLFDLEYGSPYRAGIHMLTIPEDIKRLSGLTRQRVENHLNSPLFSNSESSVLLKPHSEQIQSDILTSDNLALVNQASEQVNQWVYQETQKYRKQNKKLIVLGGDHSSPFGAIKALCEEYKGDLGILHLDAHADLRNAYQNFTHSHASIMYNVMNLPTPPKKLVQVGIRDFCEEEFNFINDNKGRIDCFFDLHLKRALLEGASWRELCQKIVGSLPQKVYISFDIDGLNPALCPHTGTPVLGGLSAEEVFYLFSQLKKEGKEIVGADLNEVSPGVDGNSEWDANVGARMLYKLCGLIL